LETINILKVFLFPNSNMFLTHLELGKKAILRNGNKSIVVEKPKVFLPNGKELDYISPSLPMKPDEAEERIEDLEESVDSLSIHPFGESERAARRIIWAHSKDKRNFSVKLGPFGYFANQRTVNFEELVRQRSGNPFAEVTYDKSSKEIRITGSKAPMEEILDQTILSLDIETMGWEPYSVVDVTSRISDNRIRGYLEREGITVNGGREELVAAFVNSLNSNLKEETFSVSGATSNGHTFILWQYGKLLENTPEQQDHSFVFDGFTFRPEQVYSEDGLIERLSDVLQELDAYVLINSNIGFDLSGLRNDRFNPAPDDSGPKQRASQIGVVKPMRMNGMQILEMVGIGQHGMPQTPDNKLHSVANPLLGLRTSKLSGYGRLKQLTLELLLGVEEAKQEFLDYSASDAVIPMRVGQATWETIVSNSMMLGQDPTVITTTSKKETGRKAWQAHHFKDTNAVGGGVYKKEFENFTLGRHTLQLLGRTNSGIQSGRDNTYAKLIHLTPTIQAFEPILTSSKNVHAREVYDLMRNHDNKAIRLMCALYLGSYLETPLWELYEMGTDGERNMSHPRDNRMIRNDLNMRDWLFGQRYGLDSHDDTRGDQSSNIMTVNNRIHQKSNELSYLLRGVNVINYSDNFVLVTHDSTDVLEKTADEMVAAGLAIDMGSGNAISFTKGRFAILTDDDGLVSTQGFDLGARKGYRADWEIEGFSNAMKLALESGRDYVRTFLSGMNRELRAREAGLGEDTARHGRIARDTLDYTPQARKQERIRFASRTNAKKGDIVAQQAENVDEFLNRMYSSGNPLGQLIRSIGIKDPKAMASFINGADELPLQYSLPGI
jgi:hypothetical protein